MIARASGALVAGVAVLLLLAPGTASADQADDVVTAPASVSARPRRRLGTNR